jgi:hypothetical protein
VYSKGPLWPQGHFRGFGGEAGKIRKETQVLLSRRELDHDFGDASVGVEEEVRRRAGNNGPFADPENALLAVDDDLDSTGFHQEMLICAPSGRPARSSAAAANVCSGPATPRPA